ncbi:hypothetical protein [Haloarchaeobius sp. FL176]|uniref:hypothetical protein n=1 Tax=Haloarchaeobius sp. FL176 TaxID=2967129 RepID=UPI0021491EEF|nr:hypothetical protein [Haloarchaeobius sp. FL176]
MGRTGDRARQRLTGGLIPSTVASIETPIGPGERRTTAAEAVIVLLSFVALLAIVIVPMLWVSRDARVNSTQSGGMWAAVAFFAWPLVVLVLSLVFAREKGTGYRSQH